jgi:hypothetical protein
MMLAEANKLDEIKKDFPGEYFRFSTSIENIVIQAHMHEKQSRLPEALDLHRKNFYIWGHAETGKTWLARWMAGARPYSKAQNKRWDEFRPDNTWVVFRDITPMTGSTGRPCQTQVICTPSQRRSRIAR